MCNLVRKSEGGGHVSSFERGGPLARGAMFLLSRGGGHWHGGSIGMGGGGTWHYAVLVPSCQSGHLRPVATHGEGGLTPPPPNDKQCRQFPPENPTQCGHPKVPTGTLTEPSWQPPPNNRTSRFDRRPQPTPNQHEGFPDQTKPHHSPPPPPRSFRGQQVHGMVPHAPRLSRPTEMRCLPRTAEGVGRQVCSTAGGWRVTDRERPSTDGS